MSLKNVFVLQIFEKSFKLKLGYIQQIKTTYRRISKSAIET